MTRSADDAPRRGPRHLADPAELLPLVGTRLGTTGSHRIEQATVDRFADVTGDRQWIHVDADRARSGPFGGTVVHGYLTLALLPVLLDEVVVVDGARLILNYGLDRVRFPAALPVGSDVTATVDLSSCAPCDGGLHAAFRVSVTAARAPKPCCVADSLLRYIR